MDKIHQLRDYAQQSLRRAQQRLLSQVLQQMPAGSRDDAATQAVDTVLGRLILNGHPRAAHAAAERAADRTASAHSDLDHAMLEVWALSEAASAVVGVA